MVLDETHNWDGSEFGEQVNLTDPQKEALKSLLAAQARINRRCEKTLVESGGVTLEVYDVLVTLESEPGMRLRMSELADRVLLSRSGVTRLVDRLEQKGWIRREPCELDKRCQWAQLTPEGVQVREFSWRIYEPQLVALWGSKVDDKTAGRLTRFFESLAPIST